MLKLPLEKKQDSSKFTETSDDPSKTLTVDGGYEYSRPLYTRRPRKTWTIAFTNLTDEERQELMDFWDKVKGGSNAFYWWHPIRQEYVLVRFKSSISFEYKGAGTTYRWNSSQITLKEV